MGRFATLLFLLCPAALTGCDNVRDLFSAHADAAAQVGDQQLTPERLSKILSGAKGLRANREAADYVSNVWVDYSLFAQAAAEGKLPLDSAGVAEVVWPEMAELRGSHWHDTLMARRSNIPPNAADSLYKGNEVRLLQHILFRVEPNAAPAVRTAARRKAEGTLARLKRGADFGDVAAKLSEDPGSRQDRGFLPPSPKGKFVTAFDSAGWLLAPGGTSGVVETPFGYHIIKRPSQEAVQDRLTAYLAQTAGTRLDSIYMDSLALTKKIKVVRGAPAIIRAAGQDPDAARRSNKTLVNYKGGELTVGEFMRWVQALPPQYVAQLKQANDSNLTQFARVLAQNVLLLEQADSAKIKISPEEWQALQSRYRAHLDTLRNEMGVDDASLGDSSAAGAERKKVAGLKVEQYFDRLVEGKTRLRPLPSALATVLRERFSYRVNDAGINRAVELAEAERQKDSTAAGGLQRAPGPPPVPGAAPDSAAALRGARAPQRPTSPSSAQRAPRADTAAQKAPPPPPSAAGGSDTTTPDSAP
ncbi:MAG TPA: peptidylprolyl isomerase [Gemmatimonadales bacterium]|nr:peptidylprolyl isomerase [Gemmatimonadales bacterium]